MGGHPLQGLLLSHFQAGPVKVCRVEAHFFAFETHASNLFRRKRRRCVSIHSCYNGHGNKPPTGVKIFRETFRLIIKDVGIAYTDCVMLGQPAMKNSK